jgi:hypothetical protein
MLHPDSAVKMPWHQMLLMLPHPAVSAHPAKSLNLLQVVLKSAPTGALDMHCVNIPESHALMAGGAGAAVSLHHLPKKPVAQEHAGLPNSPLQVPPLAQGLGVQTSVMVWLQVGPVKPLAQAQ